MELIQESAFVSGLLGKENALEMLWKTPLVLLKEVAPYVSDLDE